MSGFADSRRILSVRHGSLCPEEAACSVGPGRSMSYRDATGTRNAQDPPPHPAQRAGTGFAGWGCSSRGQEHMALQRRSLFIASASGRPDPGDVVSHGVDQSYCRIVMVKKPLHLAQVAGSP